MVQREMWWWSVLLGWASRSREAQALEAHTWRGQAHAAPPVDGPAAAPIAPPVVGPAAARIALPVAGPTAACAARRWLDRPLLAAPRRWLDRSRLALEGRAVAARVPGEGRGG